MSVAKLRTIVQAIVQNGVIVPADREKLWDAAGRTTRRAEGKLLRSLVEKIAAGAIRAETEPGADPELAQGVYLRSIKSLLAQDASTTFEEGFTRFVIGPFAKGMISMSPMTRLASRIGCLVTLPVTLVAGSIYGAARLLVD